jgi:uncharacterized protein (TIGR00299 family) protein
MKERCAVTSLYFNCFSGAAGDMLVAALLDLGGDFEALREDLARLQADGFTIEREKRWQGGLAGTRYHVRLDPAVKPPRRNLTAILALLERSGLPAPIVANATRVFRRLGEAEAKVHGCALDEVHFHEVGALDSIADIVGFCALHHRLGAPRLFASPVAVGEGYVQTEHGLLPVPALATLELLAGVPLQPISLKEELCTPTGAALLATLCEGFGRDFEMVPRKIGYGLGTRERASPPNAVRVIACDLLVPAGEPVVVLETNLDDATGQELGRLVELALARGALDALVLPAVMKKGRPGHVVQVLASEATAPALEELLLLESPTLGVRRWRASRRVLPREQRSVRTSLGDVRVKLAVEPGGATRFAPEFDDLAQIAEARALPLPEVRRIVLAELQAALADGAKRG